jgi:hypothetical protein
MHSDTDTSIPAAESPQPLSEEEALTSAYLHDERIVEPKPRLVKVRQVADLLSGSDVETAIVELANECWDAEAIIRSVIRALMDHFEGDWPAGVPDFHRALGVAARMVQHAADNLETACLEERAAQLAAVAA